MKMIFTNMMEIVSKRNLIVLLSIAVIQYIIYTKFGFNPPDVYDDDDDEESGDGYMLYPKRKSV